MFSKNCNYPIKIEKYKIEPDEMFLNWLHQMRNPTSTDTTLRDAIKSDPTIAHPSTRETV